MGGAVCTQSSEHTAAQLIYVSVASSLSRHFLFGEQPARGWEAGPRTRRAPQLWKIDEPLFNAWLGILNQTRPAQVAPPAKCSAIFEKGLLVGIPADSNVGLTFALCFHGRSRRPPQAGNRTSQVPVTLIWVAALAERP